MTTLTVKPRSNDPALLGVADAAVAHFSEVGVSSATLEAFSLNCEEAGIRATWAKGPGTVVLRLAWLTAGGLAYLRRKTVS